MTLRRKIFIGVIVAFVLFVLLNAFSSKDDSVSLDSSGSIKTPQGGNLVSSNMLSDPTVLSADSAIGKLECKFPSNWQYVNYAAELKQQPLTMWFTSLTDKKLTISRVESNDGITWDKVKEAVLKPGPGWDAIGVETASVLKDPQGKYRMYYSSSLKEHSNFAIGLAVSDDGVSWDKNNQPVFEAESEWELNGVLEPSVIYDVREKMYKLWYSALGEKSDKLAFRIGYATSLDGINWQRFKEPVLDVGSDGTWDDVLISHVNVLKSQEGYHMFYFGVEEWCEGCAMQKGAIGHAYSQDGISWQKNPNNPIVKPRQGKWDAWTVGGPSAIIRDGEIWLWYFGNPRKDSFEGRIGLIKGSCQ